MGCPIKPIAQLVTPSTTIFTAPAVLPDARFSSIVDVGNSSNSSTTSTNLGMSASESEWLSFSGAPGEKAATFVQNLNRRAFAEGRGRDDGWLAQYIVACLSDGALEWFYSLEDDVQGSGKRLCSALLRAFPADHRQSTASTISFETESNNAAAPPPDYTPTIEPVPAAALVHQPAMRIPAPPTQRRSSGAQVGYIELVDSLTGHRVGYINSKGDKTITQDLNDVLLVELPAAANPSVPVSLLMLVSNS